ncbi:MAG: AmmeMemoRadiSam system protein B [Salinivirgaceae bacterium]|nr:MAG: AmmeMemoRadiSam system protein B [Salinivirgaceae bacterium]
MSTRKAVVAGKYYPSKGEETKKLIDYVEKKEVNNLAHIVKAELDVLGGVVPHAGIMFSGYQAVHFFHYIIDREFDSVVILSPSHTGRGPEIAIDGNDEWEIPGAVFKTDKQFIESGLLEVSSESQMGEHAAEVMLPYLDYFRPDLKQISVITIRKVDHPNTEKVAQALIEYEKQSGKKLLVIASSDFNHFQTVEEGRAKDDLILEPIKNKQENEVLERVRKYDASVCGYGPIVSLMAYARLKNPDARFGVLRRGHSGEVMPSESVVNYISMLCSVPRKKE